MQGQAFVFAAFINIPVGIWGSPPTRHCKPAVDSLSLLPTNPPKKELCIISSLHKPINQLAKGGRGWGFLVKLKKKKKKKVSHRYCFSFFELISPVANSCNNNSIGNEQGPMGQKDRTGQDRTGPPFCVFFSRRRRRSPRKPQRG